MNFLKKKTQSLNTFIIHAGDAEKIMFSKIIETTIQQLGTPPQAISEEIMPLLKNLDEAFEKYERKIALLENKLAEKEAEINQLSSRLLLETNDLKNTHNELSRIFNLVNEGFFTKDIQTNQYLHMSVGCVKIYGYASDEFFAQPNLWYEVIHPEDKILVQREHHVLSKGRQTLTTYRIIHKDGSIRWIEVKAIPILEKGKLVRVDGVVNNVSERKAAEQALKDNEEKYRSFFENSMDGILMSTPEGKLLAANPAACEIFRATEEELCQMNRSDLVMLTENQVGLNLDEFKKTGKFRGEINFRRKDGTIFPGEITSNLFKNSNGVDRSCIILRDITTNKNAEAALVLNEQQLNLIYNTVEDSIFMFGIEEGNRFKFLSVNNAFVEITGLTREKVIGKYLHEMLPEPQRSVAQKNYIRAVSEKKTISWEDVSQLRKGEVTGIVKGTPVVDDLGNCIRLIASVHDITEQKKADKQLVASERRYRTLFEQNLAGVYQSTVAGEIITCNFAMAYMLGYQSPEDLLQTNAINLYHSQSHRTDLINRLRREKKLYNYEATLKRRDGSYVHILENVSLFTDPVTGQEILDGIMLDITERKEADALLKQSEQRHRQIVETAQEGICVADHNYRLTFVNKKMCEITGYAMEEIIGLHISSFLDVENKSLADKPMERRRAGFSENLDAPLLTKTGSKIWVNISASPILDDQGNFAGSLAMVTDITKRKYGEELILQSEARLDLKNKELERKNTELEQFAYVASHDLQEPLRTTSSFVKILQKQYQGKLDEKADQYLRFIVDSSDRMKVLINDLLDYSRIGVKHALQPVDCSRIINDVIADLDTAIKDSGTLLCIGDLPVINGYPTEIKQLFQNLTINAIKFRKQGITPHVNISAAIVDNHWQFAFNDNGIGIDEAHYNRIFIIFQRLHTRTEYLGSGIGLSHCKKIVELHHGKIWVQSTPGEGSTFYFTIPL